MGSLSAGPLLERARRWWGGRSFRRLLRRAGSGATAPHRLFAGVADEDWLKLHLLRGEGRPELQAVLPGLPEEALQVESTGLAGEPALRSGFQIYRLFKGLFEAGGGRLADCERVLDFGCGWGRILRFFLRDVEAGRLWGLDAREKMIEACRRLLPACRFERAGPWPPAPLPDASVAFAYAYSVFSHLSEEMHARWVEEFHRILEPGGLLVVSTRNRQFIEVCAGFRAQRDLPPHLAHLPRLFPDAQRALAAFDGGEFCYDSVDGNWWSGEACIPRAYVAEKWSPRFALLDYVDDTARCEQNVIVARRV